MNIAIIQFPGSNCEAESIRAVKRAGMNAVEFLWNDDYRTLERCDGYVIVGGFSYEDRSRAGIIAALDPVMRVIAAEADKGKPVLGICNGAQILVETGLVPGLPNRPLGMALAANKRVRDGRVIGTGFYNAWVWMTESAPPERSAFTRTMRIGDRIRLPIAHGEGRFVMSDEILQFLEENGLTTFRYCDPNGAASSEFPVNPNGSMSSLAGVTNFRGNVLALMPHPERTPSGQPLFASLREYISAKSAHNLSTPATLPSPPETPKIQPYAKPADSIEIMTSLIITDNEAVTVEQTLERMDIHALIQRFTHWEITSSETDARSLRARILDSSELFNPNKEYAIEGGVPVSERHQTICILVRDREDMFGRSKKEALEKLVPSVHIKNVRHGTLWKISVERGNIQAVLDHVIGTHILFNPWGQEAFTYS